MGIVTFALLPKIEVNSGKYLGILSRVVATHFSTAIGSELYAGDEEGESTPLESPPDRAALEEIIQELFADETFEQILVNHFTGETIREVDSPGNYTLEEREDGVLLKMFDLTGKPGLRYLYARDGMERLDEHW